MKIVVTENYDALSEATANIVAAIVKEKPNSVFCLPAGASPVGMYARLVEMYNAGEVDFSRLITMNMDEYVGMDKTHENSFAYFARSHFLSKVNVPEENIYHPQTVTGNLEEECVRYSEKIIAFGGFDIAITGIGDDGHIAFNEPGSYLRPRTHVVQLNQATIEQNAKLFKDPAQMPDKAVSVGMEEIMKCRNFLVVASGQKKAPLLKRMFQDDHLDPMFPVSFLRMHNNVTFILDKDAAAGIPASVLDYFS